MEYSHAVLDMVYQLVADSLLRRMGSTVEKPFCRLETVETTLTCLTPPLMFMVLQFRDVQNLVLTVFLIGMKSVLSAFFLGCIASDFCFSCSLKRSQ